MFLSGNNNELRLNRETVQVALQEWLDRNVAQGSEVRITAVQFQPPITIIIMESLAEAAAIRIGAKDG